MTENEQVRDHYMFDKPLFILEIANNHQGSVEHGKQIIAAMRTVCEPFTDVFNFAVKFQYRDLDTFIHPHYRDHDIKYVKRFRETRLTSDQFIELRDFARKQEFFAICTPFDERSVDQVAMHDFDAVKVASCSFCDWPLLERIARLDKPVIASAAGVPLEDIHRVVSFFKNRNCDFSLLHCVAEYPVNNPDLQMNQIDLFRTAFPHLRIGFSTHENPDNMEPVKIAAAKGAVIFEKHVGLPTSAFVLNAYSAAPEQVKTWLTAAKHTFALCGIKGTRYTPNDKEKDDLQSLKRGVFARETMGEGSVLSTKDIFLAFPSQKGQLLAEDISKYTVLKLKHDIPMHAPVMQADVCIKDNTPKIREIVNKVISLINQSGVVVPSESVCEISHHYGLDRFNEVGVTIITCVNREYAKKILVVLPGQRNPTHMHKLKEETFTVLYGELLLTVVDETRLMKKGGLATVERGARHAFYSEKGCVFEEISTTHNRDDSYYGDEAADFIRPRKTEVYITSEMLRKAE